MFFPFFHGEISLLYLFGCIIFSTHLFNPACGYLFHFLRFIEQLYEIEYFTLMLCSFVFIIFFFFLIYLDSGLVASLYWFSILEKVSWKKETQYFRRTISEFFSLFICWAIFRFPFCLQSLWNFPSTQNSEDARFLLHVQSKSDTQMETNIAHNNVIFSYFLSELFHIFFLIGWSSSITTQIHTYAHTHHIRFENAT